jgi:hypothetical protein
MAQGPSSFTVRQQLSTVGHKLVTAAFMPASSKSKSTQRYFLCGLGHREEQREAKLGVELYRSSRPRRHPPTAGCGPELYAELRWRRSWRPALVSPCTSSLDPTEPHRAVIEGSTTAHARDGDHGSHCHTRWRRTLLLSFSICDAIHGGGRVFRMMVYGAAADAFISQGTGWGGFVGEICTRFAPWFVELRQRRTRTKTPRARSSLSCEVHGFRCQPRVRGSRVSCAGSARFCFLDAVSSAVRLSPVKMEMREIELTV